MAYAKQSRPSDGVSTQARKRALEDILRQVRQRRSGQKPSKSESKTVTEALEGKDDMTERRKKKGKRGKY